MYGYNRPGHINEGNVTLVGEPYEPRVPPVTPDQERRHFSIVNIAREAKIIYPTRPIPSPFEQGKRSQLLIPMSLIEVPWLSDIGVPAPSNHEEIAVGLRGYLESHAKVRSQHYVAVRITQNLMAGDFVGAIKDVIEVLRAMLIAAYKGLMADSQIPASLSRTFFVSKEDNLYVRMQQCPALERIPLDYIAVTLKGFGSGKDCQHPRFGPLRMLS